MTDGEVAAAAAVAVAALGALASLGAKFIEKHKPIQERRAAEDRASADRRIGHATEIDAIIKSMLEMGNVRDAHARALDSAIQAQQSQIDRMSTEIGQFRRKLSMFYSAIARSQQRFPDTRQFWDEELAKIDA